MTSVPLHRALRWLFPSRRVTSDRLADFRAYWTSLHAVNAAPDGPSDPCEALAEFRAAGIPGDTWEHLRTHVAGWLMFRRREQAKKAGKKSGEARKLTSGSRKDSPGSRRVTRRTKAKRLQKRRTHSVQ